MSVLPNIMSVLTTDQRKKEHQFWSKICGRAGKIKKFCKKQKFAEICLYSRSQELFTIQTKMAVTRPILEVDPYLFSNETLLTIF